MINSQKQEGGDGSHNMQAQQMVVHIGIDEKRAREIYQEMMLQVRDEYTREALIIANDRVNEFEKRLFPKMEQVEGALNAFADPSFQLLLVEAQKTAASTERLEDYDLLAELLIHRFQKGENRIARAGISLAVGIVDKVSNEALLGLTVAHSVSSFQPRSGDIFKGLDVLNDLYGKIFYGELPIGQEWLDHLDVLNAVRLNSLGHLKKTQEFYTTLLNGYVDVGIQKKSEQHDKAIEILKNNHFSDDWLVEHALNSDFVRVVVASRKQISSLSLNQEQIKAIDSIYDLYSQDGNIKQNNIVSFMEEWNKRPNLKTLREWWDNVFPSFSITSVGMVLAQGAFF
jgi:hypothetical protein